MDIEACLAMILTIVSAGLEEFFGTILIVLTAVSFITLALIFLYMIYGKEKETT